MSPKISIIVPVYNVEAFLPQCLNSILAQTFTDFELICVDDGSPDNSGKILDDYAAKDARIKVIHQQNAGLVGARNSGVDMAGGKYICFVDSDDHIAPQLLEICYTLAEKENADWVCFQMQTVRADEEIKPIKYNTSELDYIVTNNPLIYCTAKQKYELGFSVWSKLYLRSFYLQHRFDLKIRFEDYPQTLDFCASHPKTVCLKEPLYFYTDNCESISRSNFTVQKIKDYHTGLNYVYEIYKSRPQELKIVIKNVFGRVLKRQLSVISHSEKAVQQPLWQAFAEELTDLNNKGCIKLSGSKIKNWLKYRWLIYKTSKGER
ncbi:MAG: glycosyltransferase [Alphaproteobacteria bacterium]|nr:glycosyltransferase [Alphaproteobacteria bacterium]